MAVARSRPRAAAIPRVRVVLPAALSPAIASITGRRGGWPASLRCSRISLWGTTASLPPPGRLRAGHWSRNRSLMPRMRTTLGDGARSRFPRSGEAAGEEDARLSPPPPRPRLPALAYPPAPTRAGEAAAPATLARRLPGRSVQCADHRAQRGVHDRLADADAPQHPVPHLDLQVGGGLSVATGGVRALGEVEHAPCPPPPPPPPPTHRGGATGRPRPRRRARSHTPPPLLPPPTPL